MRCKILIFLLIGLFTNIENSVARPIISGISTNEVDIDTSFTGAEILLFGAKGDAGNIIIVVRGPRKNYIVNKKGETLGIWHTERRVKFKNAYSYYALFSSNNDMLEDTDLLAGLEIGKNNIKLNSKGKINGDQIQVFQEEFVNKLEKNELYSDSSNKIDFLDETLFKVILKFPKNIASGVYTAEIYLIDEDNLLAFQSIPIYVNQTGLSARIHNMAYEHSVFYGLIAILIAVISGWLANFIFNKFFGK
jgi:uncharacterized protein (TIGR02186 family)